jgi:hypothetical protein
MCQALTVYMWPGLRASQQTEMRRAVELAPHCGRFGPALRAVELAPHWSGKRATAVSCLEGRTEGKEGHQERTEDIKDIKKGRRTSRKDGRTEGRKDGRKEGRKEGKNGREQVLCMLLYSTLYIHVVYVSIDKSVCLN